MEWYFEILTNCMNYVAIDTLPADYTEYNGNKYLFVGQDTLPIEGVTMIRYDNSMTRKDLEFIVEAYVENSIVHRPCATNAIYNPLIVE